MSHSVLCSWNDGTNNNDQYANELETSTTPRAVAVGICGCECVGLDVIAAAVIVVVVVVTGSPFMHALAGEHAAHSYCTPYTVCYV